MNYNRLAVCISLSMGMHCGMQAFIVEKPNRLTRLFWDTSSTIDKDAFNNVLILVNKCLELKLENDLFVATLRQLSLQLKQINTDLESQAILKQRIDGLIKALSQRSTSELADVDFLRALFTNLNIPLS